MKNKKIQTMLLAFLLIMTGSNSYCQSTYSDDEILKTLHKFYSAYITATCSSTPDQKKVKSIYNKYCTQKLLKDIQGLDYDPFINAQDCAMNLLKNLKIYKAKNTSDLFIVTYPDDYDKSNVIIKLKVIKQEGVYKINEILDLGVAD
jgi:hypothetical protein